MRTILGIIYDNASTGETEIEFTDNFYDLPLRDQLGHIGAMNTAVVDELRDVTIAVLDDYDATLAATVGLLDRVGDMLTPEQAAEFFAGSEQPVAA